MRARHRHPEDRVQRIEQSLTKWLSTHARKPEGMLDAGVAKLGGRRGSYSALVSRRWIGPYTPSLITPSRHQLTVPPRRESGFGDP